MANPSWDKYPLLRMELDLDRNENLMFKGKSIHVLELAPGTNKKLDWKCSTCDHNWMAGGNQRVQGSGCPACYGRVVHSDGRNAMSKTHPELAREYQGDASRILAGTNKKLDWKCSTCEHEWTAIGSSRVRSQASGCPACANQAIHIDGRNSLAYTHPELAIEYQGDATTILSGTGEVLDWKCSKCEYYWKARGRDRTVRGSGCPVCYGRVVHSDGRNSMAVTHPELAKEYQGDATKIIAGTSHILDWKCSTCDYEWQAKGNNRASSNSTGCPVCANRIIHPDGRNSMAKTHPELAKEYQGDAEIIVAGTARYLGWKCGDCQHEWKAPGSHRAAGIGCPSCAERGFQAGKPAYYYVNEIFNEMGDRIYFKGGISFDWEIRLQQLSKGLPEGLTIQNLEFEYFENGQVARNLESEILKHKEIRAPKRNFMGGNELFLVNPLEFIREIHKGKMVE